MNDTGEPFLSTHAPSEGEPMWMEAREWRDPAGFAEYFQREFPAGASEWDRRLSRRRFVQLMGASVGLASLAGCRLPPQKIVPYTEQPEKLIPGRALHYATTLQINGHPRGVVVTSHEGRPTHISGNALHPLSHGANDIWTGAAVLELYDPDRLQTVLYQGGTATWDAFTEFATTLSANWAKTGGEGVCFLTGEINSPTWKSQFQQLLAKYPRAAWYRHEVLETPPLRSSTGEMEPSVNLANADVIFALESDFLLDRPDSLALTRSFSQRRQTDALAQCNRLYVAESCPTITGAKADHRFIVSPKDFSALADALLHALGTNDSGVDPRWPWLSALVADLRAHGGRCLLLGGRALPDDARHRLAAANRALGNEGKTISYRVSSSLVIPSPLEDLVSRLRSGEVTCLIMLGGNPIYDAPADFELAKLLKSVPTKIHHTLFANETSSHSNWVVNAAHDLEAWGDAHGSDGTESICQPLIAPLYDGKSGLELTSLLVESTSQSGYQMVRQTWTDRAGLSPDAFEAQWHTWLREGLIRSLSTPGPSSQDSGFHDSGLDPAQMAAPASDHEKNFWLAFRPSAALWDGRHANNGWLQELADPITKLTWDNAALLSPAMAKKLGVADGDVVKITASGVSIEAPVLVTPGHSEATITLTLGYGRMRAGQTGSGVGFNAYLLRRSTALWQMPADHVERTGRTHPLARTQEHFRMEGRDLLHVARLDEQPPQEVSAPSEPPVTSLYPKVDYAGHAWAMTIDLNTCIGCNACLIACQSENNIPVVGKEQVLFGREMQWIRVDRYFQGPEENPRAHFQPVPCMQCENAPCEVVCPVAATQHDDEGLNVMVYNRCVGTRYCSNNCPYKVRRFNFFNYNGEISESRALGLNPNVTVRSRGVMEKCTYCVQRIEEARISARREHRPLQGTDITTACQDSCPAEAIVFGDLNDPASVVSLNRKKSGHYALLGELDTRPRTTYLEKKLNLNPELEPGKHTDHLRALGI